MRRLAVLALSLALAAAFTASCDTTKPPPPPVAGLDAEAPGPDAEAVDPGDAGVVEGLDAQDPGLNRKDASRPYPPGGGTDYVVGAVVENIVLSGFTQGIKTGSVYRPIELAEFYDPDGSKGYKTLFVNIGSRWCPYCKLEAAGDPFADPPVPSLNDLCQAKAAKGLVCYSAILEDEAYNPAEKIDISWWANEFGTQFAIVADPNFRWTVYGKASAVPHNLFIDTKTMKLMAICHGADSQCIDSNMELYTQ